MAGIGRGLGVSITRSTSLARIGWTSSSTAAAAGPLRVQLLRGCRLEHRYWEQVDPERPFLLEQLDERGARGKRRDRGCGEGDPRAAPGSPSVARAARKGETRAARPIKVGRHRAETHHPVGSVDAGAEGAGEPRKVEKEAARAPPRGGPPCVRAVSGRRPRPAKVGHHGAAAPHPVGSVDAGRRAARSS